MQFPLFDRVVGDRAVALIAQHRFDEADLERGAEIEDSEAIRWDPSTRVAEAAWCLADPEGVRIAPMIDAAEAGTRRDRHQVQCGASERRTGTQGGHSGECPSDTFRRFHHLGCPASLDRRAAGQPFELGMMLNQEAIDRPRIVADPIKQLWQRLERLAVVADLPVWEAEPTLGPLQPKDLMVLALGVDRDAASAQELCEF